MLASWLGENATLLLNKGSGTKNDFSRESGGEYRRLVGHTVHSSSEHTTVSPEELSNQKSVLSASFYTSEKTERKQGAGSVYVRLHWMAGGEENIITVAMLKLYVASMCIYLCVSMLVFCLYV